MSGSHELAAHCEDQLSGIDGLTLGRFFGGWEFRSQEIQFAIVMDELYFRVDDGLRARLRRQGSRPFRYRGKQGRMVTVERYYSVPADVIDDPDSLSKLAAEAVAAQQS